VDELKKASDRPVAHSEWERFDQLILNAVIAEWWRRCRLSARVRVSGTHFKHQLKQTYNFSYFAIYLPKDIKLMES